MIMPIVSAIPIPSKYDVYIFAGTVSGFPRLQERFGWVDVDGDGIFDHPNFRIPAHGKITSEYGPRIHPIEKIPKHHDGIDIANNKGTPIYPATRGKVIIAKDFGSKMGKWIFIEHENPHNPSNRFVTKYGHVDEILVDENEYVNTNEIIAKMGKTGKATGIHLHFEIRKVNSLTYPLTREIINKGRSINPRAVLPLPPEVLKLGSSGDGVVNLQQKLIDAGYDVGPYGLDGIFRPGTKKAVEKFQKAHGLNDDGIVGKFTRAAMDPDLGGVDFTSINLNYILAYSDPKLGIYGFDYMLKAKRGEKGVPTINFPAEAQNSMDFFFIGLTLPDYKFWVNLNPREPERIINQSLGKTDVGRIMLEADLRMKKDFCRYENPCSSEVGEKYQQLLDKKQEELVTTCTHQYPGEIKKPENVPFQAAIRSWIVPDEITAYENENEVYIVNSTLTIMSEPVYEHSTYKIVNQDTSKVSEGCRRCLDDVAVEYGRYATELGEEMIYPLVVQEVNNNESYSDLRQVYTSLALAQWYKDHICNSGMFSDLIDSEDLTGLESEAIWNPTDIWEKYAKSYEKGEYHCKKKTTHKEGRFIVTETKVYTCGGVDFGDIEVTVIGGMPSELKEITTDAIYTPFTQRDNESYYFGDSLCMLCMYAYPTVTPMPMGLVQSLKCLIEDTSTGFLQILSDVADFFGNLGGF